MTNLKNNCIIILILITIFGTTNAQVNRSGLRNNYSKSGKSTAVIRQGLTVQLAYDCGKVPFIGIGYVTSQYFGIGNRFMQQSITYHLGLQTDILGNPNQSAYIHNLIGTFHCSYIGTNDLNPFIYGIAIHFATAKDKNVYINPSDYNTKKGEYMSNIYLRPELGIAYPFKYSSKTIEKLPFTFTLMYGYNIRLFMYRNELNEIENANSEFTLPWTSINHHLITLRFNFNFVHYREFQ